MSLIFMGRKENAIEVVTDAGEWDMRTGCLTWIGQKQYLPPHLPGYLTVPIGWRPAGTIFTRLAHQYCPDLDALLDHAPVLWQAVERIIAPKVKAELVRAEINYGICFCGWSEKKQRLEAFTIDPVESPDLWEIDHLLIAPGDPAVIDDIIAKVAADPEAFHPETDGVEMMETLRRCPKQFGQGQFSAVGGFVLATTVIAAGGYSRIVHRWDDQIGQPIHLPERNIAHAISDAVPTEPAIRAAIRTGRAVPSRSPDFSAATPALQSGHT